MKDSTIAQFAQAAKTLCELRCVDPNARVYFRDGIAMPDGPTNQLLAASDLFRFAQISCALQKHNMHKFKF